MNNPDSRVVAPIGLLVGALLGMAGTFVPSASVRGLLWGVDGIALITATALLTLHHFRRGRDTVAAGFLVFVVGGNAHCRRLCDGSRGECSPVRAGAGLWAASLILVSAPRVMPSWLRAVSSIGAILFLIVAMQIFAGQSLTPLSQPLPFVAYPFLAVTLLGWGWVHYRGAA